MTRVNVCVRFEDDKRTSDTLSFRGARIFENVALSFLDGDKKNERLQKRRGIFQLLLANARTKTRSPARTKAKKKTERTGWVSPERGLRFASSLSSRYLSPSRFVPRRRSKIAARRSVHQRASLRPDAVALLARPVHVKTPAPRRSRRRASRTEERFYDRRRRRLFLS